MNVVEFAKQILAMGARIATLEHRVAHLERVLAQAVLSHGGVLTIDPAKADELTGDEALFIGGDGVTLVNQKAAVGKTTP